MAFFPRYEFVVDEEIPDRFGALSAFRKPVFDALFLNLISSGILKRIIGSQDLQSLSPWITSLFGHDEAILGLFGLPDTGEADG